MIGENGGKFYTRFGTGSSSTAISWNYSVPTGWCHVYVVRQSSQMLLYVNGALVETKNANGNVLQRNGGFSLTNGLNDSLNTSWDFSTVGTAFFSRALTASEINAAMNAVMVDLSKAPYNSGCIMAVNCTEGSGNKIKELVSGNYIELTQTPTWDVEIPVAS